MKKKLIAALLVGGMGLGFTGLPAQAQGIEFGPGGVRVYPDDRWDRRDRWERWDDRGWGDRWERRRGISEWQARRIARRSGLSEVWRVTRSRGDWIVSGEDWRGRRMRIVINAWTGDVVDIDRRGRGGRG